MDLTHIKQFVVGLMAFGSSVMPLTTPLPQSFTPEQISRHSFFHYPVIEGQKLEAKPYLKVPFSKSEIPEYDITEGWQYSEAEKSIHGHDIHGGVDFAVPYGTSVYAPIDGYAMASYQTSWVLDVSGDKKLYQGQQVRYGGGYFVQIYNPDIKRFVLLAHLSHIAPSIPFSPPEYEEDFDNWKATHEDIPIDEIPNSRYVKFVHAGEPIGKVGTSGLGLGDHVEYTAGSNEPQDLSQTDHPSWDEPHLHFEEYSREFMDKSEEKYGKKIWQRDPYAIYSTYPDYPTVRREKLIGKDPLWIMDQDEKPEYVR
jgi:murein DD-endopeptidase MepM/ murein hydrolase activator NlpD